MGFLDKIRTRISGQVQAEFSRIDREGFEQYEARLAQQQGKQPDQTLSQADTVEVVRRAGVDGKFVDRVADGIMKRLDKNGGGISAREWMNRSKEPK